MPLVGREQWSEDGVDAREHVGGEPVQDVERREISRTCSTRLAPVITVETWGF